MQVLIYTILSAPLDTIQEKGYDSRRPLICSFAGARSTAHLSQNTPIQVQEMDPLRTWSSSHSSGENWRP